MHTKERIKKMEETRIRAQSWFVDLNKRKISSIYDNRETSFFRVLSVETLISYYKVLFNRKPITFLDVGCGEGQMLEYLSKNLPEAILTGIDSSVDAINHASELRINANIICTDAKGLSLHIANETFDVIIIHLCFGLFNNPLDVLESLIPYMSNESFIYIVDLNRECLEQSISSAQTKDEELYLNDQYNASYTLYELEQLLIYLTDQIGELTYKVGLSLIGGFNPCSIDFLSVIRHKRLQQVLRHIPIEINESKRKPPEFLHGWLIKNKTFV